MIDRVILSSILLSQPHHSCLLEEESQKYTSNDYWCSSEIARMSLELIYGQTIIAQNHERPKCTRSSVSKIELKRRIIVFKEIPVSKVIWFAEFSGTQISTNTFIRFIFFRECRIVCCLSWLYVCSQSNQHTAFNSSGQKFRFYFSLWFSSSSFSLFLFCWLAQKWWLLLATAQIHWS